MIAGVIELLADLDSIESRLIEVMLPEEITEMGQLLADMRQNRLAGIALGKTSIALAQAIRTLGRFDALLREAKRRADVCPVMFRKGDRVIFTNSVSLHGQHGTVVAQRKGSDHLGNPYFLVEPDGDNPDIGGTADVYVANVHFVPLTIVDRLAELA